MTHWIEGTVNYLVPLNFHCSIRDSQWNVFLERQAILFKVRKFYPVNKDIPLPKIIFSIVFQKLRYYPALKIFLFSIGHITIVWRSISWFFRKARNSDFYGKFPSFKMLATNSFILYRPKTLCRSVDLAFGHRGCWWQPCKKCSVGKDSLRRATESWNLPSPLRLADPWENSSNGGVSKKWGCLASHSWLHNPRKDRKQGVATLHQKQRRIPLLYRLQHEGRSSCPASSSLFYRYSSHSQYCLANEGKDRSSSSSFLLILQSWDPTQPPQRNLRGPRVPKHGLHHPPPPSRSLAGGRPTARLWMGRSEQSIPMLRTWVHRYGKTAQKVYGPPTVYLPWPPRPLRNTRVSATWAKRVLVKAEGLHADRDTLMRPESRRQPPSPSAIHCLPCGLAVDGA